MEKSYIRKLRELKENRNLLNIDISKVLKCSPSQYGRLENGKRLFSIEQIIQLSNFYKVSIDYILGNEKNKLPIKYDYVFDYDKFLKQIVALRLEHNYTQTHIASEILNISQSMYSRYELKTHVIDILSIVKLANLYKVSISYLLGLEIQ